MPDEDQFAGKKVFESDQLFVLANHRVGALFPRQADIGAEALFRSGAFVPRLHNPAARARYHHETRFHDLAAELKGLLVLHAGRLRAGRAENRYLATPRIRSKKSESIAQFAEGGLDHLHIPGVLHISQQFKGVLNDVGHIFLIESSALIIDELLNAAPQFQVSRRLFCRFYHAAKDRHFVSQGNCGEGRQMDQAASQQHHHARRSNAQFPSPRPSRGERGNISSARCCWQRRVFQCAGDNSPSPHGRGPG